jgi:hypothetical protein
MFAEGDAKGKEAPKLREWKEPAAPGAETLLPPGQRKWRGGVRSGAGLFGAREPIRQAIKGEVQPKGRADSHAEPEACLYEDVHTAPYIRMQVLGREELEEQREHQRGRQNSRASQEFDDRVGASANHGRLPWPGCNYGSDPVSARAASTARTRIYILDAGTPRLVPDFRDANR